MEIDLQALTPYAISYGLRLLAALGILLVVWLLSRVFRSFTRRALGRLNFDLTLTIFLSNAVGVTILLLGLLACLSIFGIETTSFAAVLGAAGLAIGLAFQGSLSNIAAGVMLLVFRPLKIGDFVRAGGESGTVDDLGLFTTALNTPDNRRLIIPNSAIFGSTIENVTYHSTRRVDFTVGCSYDADLNTTRMTLQKAVDSVSFRLADKDTQILLMNLAASSVDWQVRMWCDTNEYWQAREALIHAIKTELDAAGIGIPYQQIDVHMNPTNV